MSAYEPWSQLSFQTTAPHVDSTKLRLLAIEGTTEVSHLYRFELLFEYDEDGGLPLEAISEMLCHGAIVRWDPTGLHAIHGVLDSIETESIDDVARIRYRAVLVPRLARLDHAVRSRVHSCRSSPERTRSARCVSSSIATCRSSGPRG